MKNHQFIDDEAEESELDSGSDDENNLSDVINDSGEEDGSINNKYLSC